MPFGLIVLYAVFFLCSVLFSWLINSLLYRFSRTLGGRQRNHRHVIRWSSSLKPSVGGFSFYMLLLLSMLVHMFFVHEEIHDTGPQLQGLFLACTLGFVLGLADDAYDTIPLLKFSVQLLCGFALLLTGTAIALTGHPLLDGALTLFWVVGMMNAINMLDNMDGVAATVCFFVLSGFLLVLAARGLMAEPYVLISVGMMGALLGFLRLNWKPARIYMGDTGSQLLGVCLAGLGLSVLWNHPEQGIQAPYLRYVALPVLVFVVPLIDIGTVTLWRLSRRQSPFVGGRDHISHHLVYLGLSERQVVFVLGGLSAVAAVAAGALCLRWDRFTDTVAVLVLGILFVVFLAMQFVYYLGKHRSHAHAGQELSGSPAALESK
ncbi:MAG: MraY family glycosyltransferase [Chitinophagales bacterium]|nr:undecaprenyl/decaprenyl-phosphate alpha-N-acetylglucosaminyl 1-phosphate transferase [Chitinophagales bacterium]MDW8394141.1 MraY family glycosyltransferase [Chitinophagales bacterium]